MTLLQFLTDYWQFIGAIVATLISWWRFSIKFASKQVLDDQRLRDVESKVIEAKAKVEAVSPILVTLQTDMASVKTSLDFIKERVK